MSECPMCLGVTRRRRTMLVDTDRLQQMKDQEAASWDCLMCRGSEGVKELTAAAYRLGGLQAAMQENQVLELTVIEYIEEYGNAATENHVLLIDDLWRRRRVDAAVPRDRRTTHEVEGW